MKAKDYLKQAYKAETQIRSKLEQVETLRSLAEKTTTTLSHTPKGTDQRGQVENILAKIIDMETEINGDIDRLLDLKNEVSELISKIIDPDLRLVLEFRYLCYKSWSQIAAEMHYDIRQVHRLHSQALRSIEKDVTKCH